MIPVGKNEEKFPKGRREALDGGGGSVDRSISLISMFQGSCDLTRTCPSGAVGVARALEVWQGHGNMLWYGMVWYGLMRHGMMG